MKTGYTLIELLIVISIIGMLSVVAFVNFKDFSKDQQLKKAVGEVQSFLRLAQSNATSSVFCNGAYGVAWKVIFDTSKLEIKCGDDVSIKTFDLQSGITQTVSGCSDLALPFKVSYSALKGERSILDNNGVLKNCGDVIITLTNDKGGTKSLTLTSGGAINVQ